MPDTRRKKSEILALFADNNTQDITPQDLRDAIVSIFGGYAGYFVGDNTGALTVSETPGRLPLGWELPNNGLTTISSFYIAIDIDGTYLVEGCLSFKGTVSKKFLFEVYVNDVAANIRATATTSSTADECRSISLSGILELVSGDTISLYVSSTDGGTSFTQVNSQFLAIQVG